MRTRRRRNSFQSPLTGMLDYQEAPRKPDDEVLSNQVQRLRDGDLSVRDAIIKGHIRLAMSIVAEFATPYRADDLVGEALLGLMQAVEWSGPHTEDEQIAPSRLHDNNITPYIAATIRRFIRDFIEKDRTVFMPGRTFRKKAASGEINVDGDNTDPVLISVVSVRLLVMDDDPNPNDESGDSIHVSPTIPFTIPEARPEEPSVEFTDALAIAVCTEDEKKVIDLRKQGYKYREIAEKMNLSVARVGQINADVEKRFDKLYACG